MCGIVGYVGSKSAPEVIINSLKRLEYRGYDSAGITVNCCGELFTQKKAGKIAALESILDQEKIQDCHIGIGHTRWATHGEPNDINAHPHSDCGNNLVLIHNGIIENYKDIKEVLLKRGHVFKSDTDTEVLAHLIEHYCNELPLLDAVIHALKSVEGTYAIVVMSKENPDLLVAARKGSPLILGIGENEMLVGSDVSAVIEHTKDVIYLEEGEVVVVRKDSYRIYDLNKNNVDKRIQSIDWDIETIGRHGFDHFMLKEIFEQPETINNAFRGRLLLDDGKVKLDGLRLTDEDCAKIERIIFIACGTSWHAGLVAEYLIEEYARIPVEVEYASEFRYRKPVLRKGDLVITISQSGETADTLAALREAKSKGIKVLGITNVVGSTIARESDGGVYIYAGPEIGVASTKAFTSQITVILLFAIFLARKKEMSFTEAKAILDDLVRLPELARSVLSTSESIRSIAEHYCKSQNFLYLGRGINFPVALEGALKLKEISYIHAEGYPAAEMKHGPIALIDEEMPVVFIATKDEIYNKVISNMQEVRARKGRIIAIATENDESILKYADHVIYIPDVHKSLVPVLAVIPLQLLSYYIAVLRGCDVDQPRNLAKSVTVE
ncbi:MAG TPA: glutamine--fructose-6-phosphate transaminase (isomerizing) [Spirochaetota bacterium]|nr:glutamine--fructose-6-phosphate transaminase (isomerizing) [Spirochaetota bacterium]HPF06439.1 glutamine--fructose-6-phosphate transaminase (isomerizing) [Spirochaetota bacterium]HPJ42872.1 glutamine--fructose-6-phosphate transaminase (isomerizing) [Spirochaetota bacterium]HPR37543.1 glutamine--fructose-6-phosphate transaminase (isomerizing) [Spirochaetota bacterium]HRX47625.1 glutamine--fructose-6-phosphate transaminase (isomerizing) [Spirochaetota bacterium]